MRQAARTGRFALVPIVLFAVIGCDGTPAANSSTQLATVKGMVRRKGKPLAKVQVMFNPANINRRTAPSVLATVGKDGRYELTTLDGVNTVSLVGPQASKINVLSAFGRTVDLKPGENTVDRDAP
jgi:hypothetical protein